MTRHSMLFGPTSLPFGTGLAVLVIGGTAYFGTFALVWLTS